MVYILGLGAELAGWRALQRKTLKEWGDALYAAGFDQWGDAGKVAAGLQTLEQMDLWPFGHPQAAGLPFIDACKLALVVLPPRDQKPFGQVTYLLAPYFLPANTLVCKP